MLLDEAKATLKKLGYKIVKEEDVIKGSFRAFKKSNMMSECGDSEYYEDDAEAAGIAYTDDEEFGECPVCVICGKECCDDEGEYSEDGDFVCADCAQNTEQEMIDLDPMSFWDNKIPDSRTPRARQIDDMEDDEDYTHFEESYHDRRHSARKMYESLDEEMLSEKLPGKTMRNIENGMHPEGKYHYMEDEVLDDEEFNDEEYDEPYDVRWDTEWDDPDENGIASLRAAHPDHFNDEGLKDALMQIAKCDEETAYDILNWAEATNNPLSNEIGQHDNNMEMAEIILAAYNEEDPDYDENQIKFIDPEDDPLEDYNGEEDLDECCCGKKGCKRGGKKSKKSKKSGKSNKGWVPYWMYKKNKKDED